MLNFRQGNDSGYNEGDSIEPYSNGEKANQTVFRRSPENLRDLNEVLRKAFDNLEAVVSSDRGLTVMSEPDTMVTWDEVGGGGTFEITAGNNLRVIPIISMAAMGGGNRIYAHLRYEPDNGGHPNEYFHVKSDISARLGGNNIFFEMHKVGTENPGSPVIEVLGGTEISNNPIDGPIAIRVQIAFDDSHTFGDVVTAINGDGDANVLVTAGTSGSWVPTQAAIVFPYQSIGLGLSPVDPVGTDSVGGVDQEAFTATAAQIAAFFAGSETPHVLAEGDVLVFDYESATVRRGQAEASSPILRVMHYAADAHADLESGNAANLHVVPMCKVYDDKLHFLNGTVVSVGVPTPLIAQPGSPFIIVGPGGHYLTIQAAITALASTGGTIFIKNGVYIESLALPNINYDITLIGEGVDTEGSSEGVVLINTAANHVITAASGASARTIFENMRFEQYSAGKRFIDADAESSSERARITFRDCVFLHSIADATDLFYSSTNLEFFDCYFKGTQNRTPLNMATVFNPFAKTAAGVMHCRVERCYFEKFASIAHVGKAATQADVGDFIFRDNVIHECGRVTAVDTFRYMLDTETNMHVRFDITGNRWSTGVTAPASGCFCNVEGKGIVSNNTLERCFNGYVPSIATYVISAMRGSVLQDGRIEIANNRIVFAGTARGNIIRASHATVQNNYAKDFNPGTIQIGIEVGDYTLVIGNQINVDIGGSTGHIPISTTSSTFNSKIIGNMITGLLLNNIGIYIGLSAVKITVSGNSITSAAAGYASGVGIQIEGAECVISGNQIDDMFYGIQLTGNAVGDDNIIANNVIRLGDNAASHGIEVDLGCNGNAILGNVVRGGAGGSSIGIDLNTSSDVAVGGNMITNCSGGTIMAAGADCGLGPTTAPDLDHNWW